MAILEGDIVLGSVKEVERKTETRRQEMRGEIAHGVVISRAQFRWPNCVIHYTIESSLKRRTSFFFTNSPLSVNAGW